MLRKSAHFEVCVGHNDEARCKTITQPGLCADTPLELLVKVDQNEKLGDHVEDNLNVMLPQLATVKKVFPNCSCVKFCWQEIPLGLCSGVDHVKRETLRCSCGCFLLHLIHRGHCVHEHLNHSQQAVFAIYSFHSLEDLWC